MLLKSPSKQKCNLDWLVATAERDGRTSAITGHSSESLPVSVPAAHHRYQTAALCKSAALPLRPRDLREVA
jgi:hypothetical protein